MCKIKIKLQETRDKENEGNLSIYLSMYACIYLSIYPLICLAIYMYVHVSIYTLIYLLSIHVFMYVCMCLSIYLSILGLSLLFLVKANLKATEKEISTLRQQLKRKINKGIKFIEESEPKITTRNDKIEKVNKEIKKEVPAKKSINLLEELERGACQDDSVSPCGLVVDNETSEIDNNDEQDLMKKEVLPPSDNIENNTTMNTVS